jgi:hypothetical protein
MAHFNFTSIPNRTQNGPIFPVKANGKTPLTPHGFKDASSDPEQIKRWQRESPGCNWGMPTGGTVVVLDIDPKHPEALQWLREQQAIHGLLDTLTILTPSTGNHLYFLPPEGIELKSTASQIAPSVDTRAAAGVWSFRLPALTGTLMKLSMMFPLPRCLTGCWRSGPK